MNTQHVDALIINPSAMGQIYQNLSHDLAIRDRITLPESWLGFSLHAYETLPLSKRQISAGDVLAFRDHAWDEYFTSPRFLSLVYEKFDAETLKHIRGTNLAKLGGRPLGAGGKFDDCDAFCPSVRRDWGLVSKSSDHREKNWK